LGHETPLTDTDPARIVAAWNEAIAAVMAELEAGLREQLRGDAAK
jgi:hypothetical protein